MNPSLLIDSQPYYRQTIAPAPSRGFEPRFPRSEHSVLPLDEEGISIVKDLAAGERFERPYPDSKSRVLPLDDPASHLQRDRFQAPYAQHRRLIDVVAQSSAIRTRTIHQFAVVSSAITVEYRRKLDLKAFEFNYLCAHNLVAARRIGLPSQPWKGRILAVRRRLILSAHWRNTL